MGRVFRRMGLPGKLACWRSHGADAAAGAPVPTQIAPLLPPPLTHCSAGSHPLQAGHRSACPHSEVERCSGHAAALCRLLRRLWGPQLRVQGLPWGSGGVAACGEGKGCLADLPGGRCAGLGWAGQAGEIVCAASLRVPHRHQSCTSRYYPWQPLPLPQDALGVDNFSSSDEAFAADALFDAYRRQASAIGACWALVLLQPLCFFVCVPLPCFATCPLDLPPPIPLPSACSPSPCLPALLCLHCTAAARRESSKKQSSATQSSPTWTTRHVGNVAAALLAGGGTGKLGAR